MSQYFELFSALKNSNYETGQGAHVTSTFKEFWNNVVFDRIQEKKQLSSGIEGEVTSLVRSTPNVQLSAADEVAFAKKVADLAQSEEIISELSGRIGHPQEDESEDEFTERASNTLRELLRERFKLR